jgi:phosphopantetheine adenylyltransferase
MTTINLYQDQKKDQKDFSYRAATSGFIFSLSILIITILALVVLKFAVSILDRQNEALVINIQNEKNSMAGLSNLEQIVDMQTRLKQIKNNLQINNNQVSRIQMTQMLDHFGTEVNAGIVVSSYKYEDSSNKISLTFNANNFSDAARQILSFKDSEYFTNVNLAKISRGEKSISCDIEMNIKS